MYLDYKEKNEYQCNDATCPCHAPTQPESSWENRFSENISEMLWDWQGGGSALKDFIRALIEEVKCKHEK